MSSLRDKFKTGIFYNTLSKYSNVVISIFIGAILARLLTPSEFGVVAIVSVFTSFFGLLSSFGIGPAIIQYKDLSKSDESSIFSFSILFGFILAVIFFFAAPLIASFYDNPVLITLARLMALSILFNSLRIVPESLNRKKLRFKYLGIASVSIHVTAGIIAIILAYSGFSYYALVIRSILSGFLAFAAFYYLEPVALRLRIKFSSIRKIAKFSSFQFFFNVINYFSNHSDNLLIGKYFSASAVGYYDKAYNLSGMPVSNLAHVINPVLHPILSEYQDQKETIYNVYSKIIKLMALLGFPISIFLFFSAGEIITILYGGQWEQSIPVFRILALTIGFRLALSSSGSIFQATNRTDLLFYAGFIGSTLVVIGILYGVFIGETLIAVGFGLLLAHFLNFMQAFYLLINRSLNFSFIKFLKTLIFPFLISASIAAALYLFSFTHIESLILSLILKALISLSVFATFLLLSKENRDFFIEYFGKTFKKKK